MGSYSFTSPWIKCLCVLCLGFAMNGQIQPNKSEGFYAGAQRAIIQLQYVDHSLGTLHTGTAFFVRKGASIYVVTAGHVARDAFSYTAIVRYLLSDGSMMGVRLTMPHDRWILHPEEGDTTHAPVDVAAMKIADHGGIIAVLYCPSDCPDKKNEVNITNEDAEPPLPVLVFGFPLNEPGLKLLRSVPLGRQGIVALVDKREDEVLVDGGKYFDRRGFVLDIPTIIGGNSGSPVLSNAPFQQMALVGIISASTEEGNAGAYARAGGYAVAEPSSRIKEVLDSPKTEQMQPVDTWCLVSEADAKRFTPPPPFPACPAENIQIKRRINAVRGCKVGSVGDCRPYADQCFLTVHYASKWANTLAHFLSCPGFGLKPSDANDLRHPRRGLKFID